MSVEPAVTFKAEDRRSRFAGLATRAFAIELVVFIALVWLFGGVLEEVLDNASLVHLDLSASAWFHAHATTPMLRFFALYTSLGSVGVWIVVIAFAAYALRAGRKPLAIAWVAANLGGAAVDTAIKLLVHRHRPEYAAAYLHGNSYSFPSGHSMGSTICFGLLAYLATREATPARRWAAYLLALLLVLSIGFSRVYLGVHYPSDVLGGFAAGAAWLTVCIAGFRIAAGRATGVRSA